VQKAVRFTSHAATGETVLVKYELFALSEFRGRRERRTRRNLEECNNTHHNDNFIYDLN
jgi:hypothetical protein